MYVQVSIARRTLKIDVVDSGDCFDLRMKLLQEPRSEGGRGLHIVKSLTSKFTLGKTRDFHCQLSAVVAL
jgi:anti-sigma regulatory factor (Ser/Thr protein kinase)